MSEFYEKLKTYVGREVGDAMAGPDDVNVAMIRHWCEAMGDTNPVYTDPDAAAHSVHGGIVAPPTMLQAWVMRPFGSGRPAPTNNPYVELLALLDTDFPSVVATNCEQTYNRYLRPGDKISMRTVIDSVSEEKTTGLGTGHFVTSRQDYYANDGELVGSMLFRILRFRPAPKKVEAAAPATAPKPPRPRPSTSADQGRRPGSSTQAAAVDLCRPGMAFRCDAQRRHVPRAEVHVMRHGSLSDRADVPFVQRPRLGTG
jgi:uncharacterized protein